MTGQVKRSSNHMLPVSVPTRDKAGKLALSPKQKAIFSRWVRPDDICNNPTMIMSVSSFSIKQVRLACVSSFNAVMSVIKPADKYWDTTCLLSVHLVDTASFTYTSMFSAHVKRYSNLFLCIQRQHLSCFPSSCVLLPDGGVRLLLRGVSGHQRCLREALQ